MDDVAAVVEERPAVSAQARAGASRPCGPRRSSSTTAAARGRRGGARRRPRRSRPARSSASSGPNGAGKSTTVRMLTTLLTITSGTAARGRRRRGRATPTRRGGASASRCRRPGSTRARPGRELLVLQAPAVRPVARGRGRRAREELLELVELEDAADRRIKGYSGGMKRRLDLASALVHEPEVLFLDEPTTGLDPASRLTVWDEVRRINERGTTVFLTTQYLEEADQLCDRLAIIDDGRIVREGTPAQLKAELRERRGLDERADARRRVPRRHRPHPRAASPATCRR